MVESNVGVELVWLFDFLIVEFGGYIDFLVLVVGWCVNDGDCVYLWVLEKVVDC